MSHVEMADVPAAVLAGGLATRLGDVARSVPKALIEVAGRPFIDHQLALLRHAGVRRVVLCVGHLGEQLERHVGDGAAHDLAVRYAYDGAALLGTGGALRQAAPLLGELFWVMYGDSYTPVAFGEVLRRLLATDALACMTVLRNENRWGPSNVLFCDGRLVRYDKRTPTADMAHIDFGVSLVRRAALAGIPPEEAYDLAELYRDLVAAGRMIGYEVTERFHEIGSPAALAETRTWFEEEAHRMYIEHYLAEARQILERLDTGVIDRLVSMLVALRARGGRLFVLGVGGSAGNASHAVNDFRKLCQIEAYAPTDNVSELTARVNDDGWDSVFSDWLRVSRLAARDMVLVFSVGGGSLERNISPNLVHALQLARDTGTPIAGVVGRDGGYTAKVAEACVIVPTVSPDTVTPHAEAFQAVVWHLVVSHPKLRTIPMKWESVREASGF